MDADGKQLGSVETLESFEAVIAGAASGDGQSMVVYMNAANLSVATALQNPDLVYSYAGSNKEVFFCPSAVGSNTWNPDPATTDWGSCGYGGNRVHWTTGAPTDSMRGIPIGTMKYPTETILLSERDGATDQTPHQPDTHDYNRPPGSTQHQKTV